MAKNIEAITTRVRFFIETCFLRAQHPCSKPTIMLVFSRNVTFFRYTCVGWPHKIEIQLEATAEHLEDDEERFQKNLLNEQNTFQDRLDALNMVIAGFSAHTDINK